MCWTGLLQQATSAGKRALGHRHLPYIRLLEAVRARHPQVGTLYGAVFACQPEQINGRPLPFGGGSAPGIDCTFREIPAPACQAPLQLLVYPGEHGARLQLEYDTRSIPDGFARTVLAHYQGMLAAMLREPEGRIAEACYLPVSEIDMQWRQWNAGNIGATAADCDLVTRLLQQSAWRANDIAVIDANGNFTYEEFARVATQYCAGLTALGVAAGDRVGIALPRDRYLPAAITGALMCGAAYVPLDLDYPEERLRYILDNSRAKIVVTTAAQAGHFEAAGVRCFFYRDDLPQAKPESVPSSAVAYVLYTSGSTGLPKGVKVSHGSIVSLIDWASRILSERERKCVLASTSVCFDLSVFEFFVPLCLGTTCVVVNRILDLLDGVPAPVTLINTVPSAIDALVESGAIPDSVETALVAGEPFRQHLVERLYRTSRVRRVLDLYGPTEDTVYSTYAERRPGGLETIGRPVGGGRAYILDANQQPVPVGLAGELYLAGAGLAEGYEGRPDLTNEAFTTPAVLRHLEQRCYRTGDIVRYTPDGRLVYLGRRDYQVKLRGYRIELLEVEAVLQAYTAVHQAVARVVTLQNGEASLVAYIVWDIAATADPEGLREHAARRLPAYMCPAIVMSLATLPRTLNGKIDRKALPAPDMQPPAQSTLEDATDIALAGVWAEVLRNKPLHRDTHFVDMGGSSLSAVQLRAAIRRRFDVDIPLALLLAHPILGEQGDLLRRQQQPATIAGRELEEIEL
jgi:amino acid adenylation domain-containing protein